ncbi:MAG: hypothetical protein DRP46_11045 [Candidatus Zixiibacteriota bacterium]|nr:MAG: hypothetical protein DRP46_11045 [candidate division Zixibacteria bacterium]
MAIIILKEFGMVQMRCKNHQKKCDTNTRAYDKTKPNVCNMMSNTIVQRIFWRFLPDSAENRYRIVRKIAPKSVMKLIFVRLIQWVRRNNEDEIK